jgi:hypothetical protein
MDMVASVSSMPFNIPKNPISHNVRSAIKNALNIAIAIPCIPSSFGAGLGGDVDWLGAFLGVVGLILFNFSFK